MEWCSRLPFGSQDVVQESQLAVYAAVHLLIPAQQDIFPSLGSMRVRLGEPCSRWQAGDGCSRRDRCTYAFYFDRLRTGRHRPVKPPAKTSPTFVAPYLKGFLLQ